MSGSPARSGGAAGARPRSRRTRRCRGSLVTQPSRNGMPRLFRGGLASYASATEQTTTVQAVERRRRRMLPRTEKAKREFARRVPHGRILSRWGLCTPAHPSEMRRRVLTRPVSNHPHRASVVASCNGRVGIGIWDPTRMSKSRRTLGSAHDDGTPRASTEGGAGKMVRHGRANRLKSVFHHPAGIKYRGHTQESCQAKGRANPHVHRHVTKGIPGSRLTHGSSA